MVLGNLGTIEAEKEDGVTPIRAPGTEMEASAWSLRGKDFLNRLRG